MDAVDIEPKVPAESSADSRARRIAAAVERSKHEYNHEHAITEREWFLETASGPTVNKKDRQRVEYVATHRLLFDPAATPVADGASQAQTSPTSNASSLVSDILACGKLTSLSRELLATGIQAAVQAGDADSARLFARAAKTHWRSYPGLAVLSSQALNFAGELKEATHPLLVSTGSALHYPVLVALANVLHCIGEEHLTRIVANVAESRQWAFRGDMFSEDREARGGAPTMQVTALADIDRKELAERLEIEPSVINKALDRLAKVLGGNDDEPAAAAPGERVERGVREL